MFNLNSHPQQHPAWAATASSPSPLSSGGSSALAASGYHAVSSFQSTPSPYSPSLSSISSISPPTSLASAASAARTVHATNIDPTQSEKDIKFFFAHCGTIAQLTIIPPNPGRGSRTQTATVVFDHRYAAQEALMLDRCRFGDLEVVVRSAEAMSKAAGGAGAKSAYTPNVAAYANSYQGAYAGGFDGGYAATYASGYGNAYASTNGYAYGNGYASAYGTGK